MLAACGGSTTDDDVSTPHAAGVTTSTTITPPTTTGADAAASVDSAPASTARSGGAATTTAPGASNKASSNSAASSVPDLFTPPAGTYTYRVQGASTSQTGPTSDERTIDKTEVDSVTVTPVEDGHDANVATKADGDTRSIRYRSASTTAAVVELTFGSEGSTFVLSVVPDPPVPVARLPYRDGDQWEFAWQDAQAGLRAVGTGAVVGRETVGSTRYWVIEVKQKLSGSTAGTFDTTMWVDPATGRHLRQRLVTQLQSASGRDTTDVVRNLL